MKPVIIDLDRTLCWYLPEDEGDPPNYAKAMRLPGVRVKVAEIRRSHPVIIWTGRNSRLRDLTERQLAEWHIDYDELRMDKPSYACWIDDLAIHPRDWQ